MQITVSLFRFNPGDIRPPHDPLNESLLENLTQRMRGGGWDGRPLLVVVPPDPKYLCIGLTGSHRTAAAIRAGFDQVPCLGIWLTGNIGADRGSWSLFEQVGKRGNEGVLEILEERLGFDSPAVELMREEIRDNQRNQLPPPMA